MWSRRCRRRISTPTPSSFYSVVGEAGWTAFFGDDMLEAQEPLPTQLHAILAYQVRIATNRLLKNAWGEGKGKADNALALY